MNNLPVLDKIQTYDKLVVAIKDALKTGGEAFKRELKDRQKIVYEMDRIGRLRGKVAKQARMWSDAHNIVCLLESKAFVSNRGRKVCAVTAQTKEYNLARRNRGYFEKIEDESHLKKVSDIIRQQRNVIIVTPWMIGDFYSSHSKNYLTVSTNTENEDYFTPERIITSIRQALGGHIDIDPASCLEANKIVKASKIYTEEQNGLLLPWNKGSVFVNPPYTHGLLAQFVDKFCEEDFTAGIILVNSTLETIWGQKLQQHSNAVCFPKGRIQFYFGEKVYTGNTRGQAIFGRRVDKKLFKKALKDIGQCWVK